MAVTVAQVRAMALAMPGATEVVTWGTDLTWRIGEKMFAVGGPESPRVSVKASKEDQAELVSMSPETFSVAPYVGRYGWVSVRLESVDEDEMRALIIEAWRRTTPKRAVKAYDAEQAA